MYRRLYCRRRTFSEGDPSTPCSSVPPYHPLVSEVSRRPRRSIPFLRRGVPVLPGPPSQGFPTPGDPCLCPPWTMGTSAHPVLPGTSGSLTSPVNPVTHRGWGLSTSDRSSHSREPGHGGNTTLGFVHKEPRSQRGTHSPQLVSWTKSPTTSELLLGSDMEAPSDPPDEPTPPRFQVRFV